jgi:hypothetical protein
MSAEQQAFQGHYRQFFGAPLPGLDFWVAERPDVYAAYRSFSAQTGHIFMPGQPQSEWRVRSFALYGFYAISGFAAGMRYLVHLNQQVGLTKDQILEGIGIAFLHCGPRGMETIAEALADYEWIDPPQPARFPDGWAFDREAFDSGLDYSHPDLTPEELRSLEGWYERWTGEVPPYVGFLARYKPQMLKAYRNRYENLLRVLPKQILPVTLLSNEVLRGFEPGIREHFLLAKGFGLSKRELLDDIDRVLIFTGPEMLDAVDRAIGDVLERWDED